MVDLSRLVNMNEMFFLSEEDYCTKYHLNKAEFNRYLAKNRILKVCMYKEFFYLDIPLRDLDLVEVLIDGVALSKENFVEGVLKLSNLWGIDCKPLKDRVVKYLRGIRNKIQFNSLPTNVPKVYLTGSYISLQDLNKVLDFNKLKEFQKINQAYNRYSNDPIFKLYYRLAGLTFDIDDVRLLVTDSNACSFAEGYRATNGFSDILTPLEAQVLNLRLGLLTSSPMGFYEISELTNEPVSVLQDNLKSAERRVKVHKVHYLYNRVFSTKELRRV